MGVGKQECEDAQYECDGGHGSSRCNQGEIEETAFDSKVTRIIMREL